MSALNRSPGINIAFSHNVIHGSGAVNRYFAFSGGWPTDGGPLVREGNMFGVPER